MLVLWAALGLPSPGCSNGDGAAEVDSGGDADSDSDADTDADSDGDVDLPYPIVDTRQSACYDDAVDVVCPAAGAAFFGQDAQWDGFQPSYTVSEDGLTVHDNITGLTWQVSPDTNGDDALDADDKLTYDEAIAWPATVNAEGYGGFDDWRLPSIKELYSLIQFTGMDPSGLEGDDTSGLTPFIDDAAFGFAYGDTAAGERIIDSQYASSTMYVDTTDVGDLLFGVNFADGRIKGYGLTMMDGDKTFFVQLVRGNLGYGINGFVDNGDGTVTDGATGLMWAQDDSGEGMSWEVALGYVEDRNAEAYLGYDDWRLPNAKELQSIVDYTRSPGTTGSAAIDPIFGTTTVQNEACEDDFAWYWSGTTHAAYNGSGASGAYVCFGRALGYMMGDWVDIHGAGAQRSDPKGGDLSDHYTEQDCGYYFETAPQGDAVRNANFVRLVRAGEAAFDDGPGTGGDGDADGDTDVDTDADSDADTDSGPPDEAIAACEGLSEGDPCEFESPMGTITGTCLMIPEDVLACVPG
jgi:hypothetical protein